MQEGGLQLVDGQGHWRQCEGAEEVERGSSREGD